MLYQEDKIRLPRGISAPAGRKKAFGPFAMALALILSLGVLSFGKAAQAQSMPHQGGPLMGGITVVGNGTISLEPDIARATIGVEAVDESVREASDEAETRMAALLEALDEQGIAENDIQTSGFSIYSERGMEGDPEAMRYRVSNQVQVTIRDLDRVGQVLDAAIDAGANQIHGVQFDLDDAAAHEGEARAAAIADARAKAEELAELSGVTLGPVINVSEIIGDVGIPMAGAEMMAADGRGAAGTPIVPGEFDLTLRIQVTYALGGTSGEATLPPSSQEAPPAQAVPEMPAEPEAEAPATAPDDAVSEGEMMVEEAVAVDVAGSAVAPMPVPMPGTLETPTVTVEGGDEAALRRYIETTLQPLFPGAGVTAITVTVGELPSQLPLELTVDDALEIVGSTVREGNYAMSDIVFVGPAPASQWTDNLQAQLTAQGFFAPDMAATRGNPVFQSEGPGAEMVLCSEDRELMVNIVAGEMAGAAEDEAVIRLLLNPQAARDSMCDPAMHARGGYPASWMPEGLLPTLRAPEGAILQGMGSSGSDRSFEVNAQVQSDELDAQGIYEYWADTLAEEGWSLMADAEGDAAVAWSYWTREFDGDTWSAIFTILRHTADESLYSASLRIER